MAEAEDVIVDVARHTTVFVRDLWRRHRGGNTPSIDLPQLLCRIDLVITGVFGRGVSVRCAQAPARTPLVRRLFRSWEQPASLVALPATDGSSIWLPTPHHDSPQSIDGLRIMALQQAARMHRGAARILREVVDPLERVIFEILEADAADVYLLNRLPGLRHAVNASRAQALSLRPALRSFPALRQPLEAWVRRIMETPGVSVDPAGESTAAMSLRHARELVPQITAAIAPARRQIGALLYRDHWTGELRESTEISAANEVSSEAAGYPRSRVASPRSARLARRPDVRQADERDEPAGPSPWMIQTAQPLEHAEDPFGMQRPADCDDHTSADEFADSVSELAQARLVATAGSPREVLLSADPPETRVRRAGSPLPQPTPVLTYPEWDWRTSAYREPGASVHQLLPRHGPQAWVDKTLDNHRAMLATIRRQFESLRAERVRLRQQADGEEIDIDACMDGLAAARAGAALPPGLYQTTRAASRELAVLLLIDISGSTDGWVSSGRRVIDVEREALLLVCLALESLGEPYSVLAFSGEGPQYVTIRPLKQFTESYTQEVALRISGLEPENYTRAGAALRHATAELMQQTARHRLLLVLSDGKPNDVDEYDGQYGVEDMRQAVIEARLQGIFPFCLTVDRHTANYLPGVFGEHQYAVLQRPELLPTAMIGWLRRLVSG